MPNPNPTVEDWVEAYKPLDKAINKAFETRITKNNAYTTQFHLAEVRSPKPTTLAPGRGFMNTAAFPAAQARATCTMPYAGL